MNRVAAERPEDLPRLFAELVGGRDLDGLIELYEQKATLVGPDGRAADGCEAIRAQLRDLLAMVPSIEPGESRVLLADDIALLSSRWRLTFPIGTDGTRSGFEAFSTEVARRQADGHWRYLIDDPASAGIRPGGAIESPAKASRKDTNRPRQSFGQLIYDEDGKIARVTLNRPERRNALSMQLSEELTRALERVRDSETVKLLVIAGAGSTFCAGDDIAEMGLWGDAAQIVRRVRSYQRMADMLADLDKVTIAAVDGYAVGGGLEITMACDFVIATERARWGMPEVDVGITPGWGGTTRMARLIGRRMAKEINLLGALHPAGRAVELGLWNRVVPDDGLERELDALVEVVLSKNQQALRQLKLIIDRGVEADLHTAQGFEALSAGLTGAVNGAWQIPDADQAAGIAGFIGKGQQWQLRRGLARDFWTSPQGAATQTENAVEAAAAPDDMG